MAKYKVKKEYEDRSVYTIAPIDGREGGGEFILNKCSQKDLKYLYEVMHLTDYVEKIEENTGRTTKDNADSTER